MFKKMLVIMMVLGLIFTFTGNGMAEGAGQNKDGAGLYIHSVTGQVKQFNSHPGEPSQWRLCENGECDNPDPDPQGNHATADGFYEAQAWDFDFSYSRSNWGWGNDFGKAFGESMIGGELYTFADAEGYSCQIVGWWWIFPIFDNVPNEASQQGLILAESETKAWSWAKDYGLTSKAGAGIKAEDGFVIIEGSAFGKDGLDEYAESRILFGANFYQVNEAQEVGYDAGGIYAGNESGLNYFASTLWDSDQGDGFVFHLNGSSFTPDVITKGKSEVTIDPYGNYRSIVGHTENMSNISFDGRCAPDVTLNQANVFGNGTVSGVISNGSAFAGGTVNFGYTGYTNGQGVGDLNAVVNTFNGGTTAFVSGSSSAVANGLVNVPQ